MSYRRLLALIAISWILATPMVLAQKDENTNKDSNWRFGVIESYENSAAAGDLNVGWTRMTLHWAEVQAGGPETWTTKFREEQIDEELAAGRQVLGLLIGIPDWARDEKNLPAGLWLPPDDADNRWALYVRQAVERYAGRIDHWIIWNEPDIAESEIAHTWDGTVADFAQLQRTAYLAAKSANPQAVIHLAAFTYWADYYAGTKQYMARLLDELLADPQAEKHNFYFDVATAHLYFQPNQIYDLLSLFIGIMRERGLPHPIWLVETNAPPRNDPAWPVPNWTLSVAQYEQAAFIPQAMAAALAAGAERVGLYKLQDTEEDRAANPEPFGLVRMNGSKRPAYATFQIAVEIMADTFHFERERWNEVGQFRLDQPARTTTMMFARLPIPQQAMVKATSPSGRLVDMWGSGRTITATDGIFEVDLPPALCTQPIGDYCMIGGTTFYLVQAADTTPPPLPTPTASAQPTARLEETATPRPTTPAQVSATPLQTAAVAPSPTTTRIPEKEPLVTGSPIPSPHPSMAVEKGGAGETAGKWLLIGSAMTAVLLGVLWLTVRLRR